MSPKSDIPRDDRYCVEFRKQKKPLDDEVQELALEFELRYRDFIVEIIVLGLEAIVLKGIQDAYDECNRRVGTQGAPPAELLRDARRAVSELTDKLRRSISGYARKALRRIADRLLKEGRSERAILRELRKLIGREDFANSIADELKTEGETEAYELGKYRAYVKLGATGKRWITVGDDRVDEICRRNERAGEIPMADRFPSGHAYSPAHRGCRCHIRYTGFCRKSLHWSYGT